MKTVGNESVRIEDREYGGFAVIDRATEALELEVIVRSHDPDDPYGRVVWKGKLGSVVLHKYAIANVETFKDSDSRLGFTLLRDEIGILQNVERLEFECNVKCAGLGMAARLYHLLYESAVAQDIWIGGEFTLIAHSKIEAIGITDAVN